MAPDPYHLGEHETHLPEDHLSKAGVRGARANCRANPCCLYGAGEYVKGIWRDQTKYPCAAMSELQRRSTESLSDLNTRKVPLGLKNLGATCYVNSLLQSWFMDPDMRRNVLSYRPKETTSESSTPATETPLALQKLFVELEMSTATFADPSELVKVLNLQAGVQQDPQEFNKLFLQLLEATMQANLTELFRGNLEYETKCDACGTARRHSNPFYELEVPIMDDLETALASFTASESLTGNNQYECERCGGKRDAKRRIVLKELPPVLNIQLLRYQFDPHTLDKRKIKNKIAIPGRVEVDSEKEGRVSYELTAVLHHRGTSAHYGHYVADVLDQSSRRWYTFNDTEVVPMVFGEGGALNLTNSSATAKTSKKRASTGTGKRKGKGVQPSSSSSFNSHVPSSTATTTTTSSKDESTTNKRRKTTTPEQSKGKERNQKRHSRGAENEKEENDDDDSVFVQVEEVAKDEADDNEVQTISLVEEEDEDDGEEEGDDDVEEQGEACGVKRPRRATQPPSLSRAAEQQRAEPSTAWVTTSSDDAYTLVYKRSDALQKCAGKKASGNGDAEQLAMPDLVTRVRGENESRRARAEAFEKQKRQLEADILARKTQYEALFGFSRVAPIVSSRVSGYWIPAEWFASWVVGEKQVFSGKGGAQTSSSSSHDASDGEERDNKENAKPAIDLIENDDEDGAEVVEVSSTKDVRGAATTRENVHDLTSDGPTPEIPLDPSLTPNLFDEVIRLKEYLCPHGKVSIKHVGRLKILTKHEWNELVVKPGRVVDTTVRTDEVCRTCMGEFASARRGAESESEHVGRLLQHISNRVESVLEEGESPEAEGSVRVAAGTRSGAAGASGTVGSSRSTYRANEVEWVSRGFLRDLRDKLKSRKSELDNLLRHELSTTTSSLNRKRKSPSSSSSSSSENADLVTEEPGAWTTSGKEGDANFELRCPHGGLVPEKTARQPLATTDWEAVLRTLDEGAWLARTTRFLYTVPVCETCVRERDEAISRERAEKSKKSELLKVPALKTLAKRRDFGHPPSRSREDARPPPGAYALVSRRWLQNFRRYYENPNRNFAWAASVDGRIPSRRAALCETHPTLTLVSPRLFEWLRTGDAHGILSSDELEGDDADVRDDDQLQRQIRAAIKANNEVNGWGGGLPAVGGVEGSDGMGDGVMMMVRESGVSSATTSSSSSSSPEEEGNVNEVDLKTKTNEEEEEDPPNDFLASRGRGDLELITREEWDALAGFCDVRTHAPPIPPPSLVHVPEARDVDPTFEPPLCAACLHLITKRTESESRIFTNKSFHLKRLGVGVPLETDPLTGVTRIVQSGNRTTSRNAKSSLPGVSSTDTVFDTKLRISQNYPQIRCQPGQLRLFHNNLLLSNNGATLESCNVRLGDELWYDTGGSLEGGEGEDDFLLFGGGRKSSGGGGGEKEKGFLGTALMMGASTTTPTPTPATGSITTSIISSDADARPSGEVVELMS